MRKLFRTSTIFMLMTAALLTPAIALEERQLEWADLVEKVEFEDPFEVLTPDQLRDLSQVARIRGLQAAEHEING